jgi:hypothetical protein
LNFRGLPYAQWTPAKKNANKSGVTLYKPELCSPGLNLCEKKDREEAYLMDMEGNIVHTWSHRTKDSENWAPIEMIEKGDLLALVGNHHILRLDFQSNLLWKKTNRFHHELTLDEKGNIWTLIHKERIIRTSSIPISILDNSIIVISPEGNTIKEIPLYVNFKHLIHQKTYLHALLHIPLRYPGMIRSWFANRFFFHTDMKLDIFHTNSVTIVDRDIEGLCENGDILISVRNLDRIAILSRQNEKIIWEWGFGEIDRQHHATLLDNGNILLFDNGPSRGFSRVIEVNPLSRRIEWEYKAHPPKNFFSPTRGACQRLPNGNTLITDSNKGRVFEITSDGEMVWEFYAPTISQKGEILRPTIYRMKRFTDVENVF